MSKHDAILIYLMCYRKFPFVTVVQSGKIDCMTQNVVIRHNARITGTHISDELRSIIIIINCRRWRRWYMGWAWDTGWRNWWSTCKNGDKPAMSNWVRQLRQDECTHNTWLVAFIVSMALSFCLMKLRHSKLRLKLYEIKLSTPTPLSTAMHT